MNDPWIYAYLKDGTCCGFPLPPDAARVERASHLDVTPSNVVRELRRQRPSTTESDLQHIEVVSEGRVVRRLTPPPDERGSQRGRVGRCRSLLAIVRHVLPSDVRDDALDEWLDEIECAAAAGRPVVRRTASIILRALPSLAWRSRVPARARGKGG